MTGVAATFLVLWDDGDLGPVLADLTEELVDGVIAVAGTIHDDFKPTSITDVIGVDALRVSGRKGWLFGRKWRDCEFTVTPEQLGGLLEANPNPSDWRTENGLTEETRGLTEAGPVWAIAHDAECLYVSSTSPALFAKAQALGATSLTDGQVGSVHLV